MNFLAGMLMSRSGGQRLMLRVSSFSHNITSTNSADAPKTVRSGVSVSSCMALARLEWQSGTCDSSELEQPRFTARFTVCANWLRGYEGVARIGLARTQCYSYSESLLHRGRYTTARSSDSSALQYAIKGPISPSFNFAFLANERILTLEPRPLYELEQEM